MQDPSTVDETSNSISFFGDLHVDVLSVIAECLSDKNVFYLSCVSKAFGQLFERNLDWTYYRGRVEILSGLELPVFLTVERWKDLLRIILQGEVSRKLPRTRVVVPCKKNHLTAAFDFIQFGDFEVFKIWYAQVAENVRVTRFGDSSFITWAIRFGRISIYDYLRENLRLRQQSKGLQLAIPAYDDFADALNSNAKLEMNLHILKCFTADDWNQFGTQKTRRLFLSTIRNDNLEAFLLLKSLIGIQNKENFKECLLSAVEKSSTHILGWFVHTYPVRTELFFEELPVGNAEMTRLMLDHLRHTGPYVFKVWSENRNPDADVWEAIYLHPRVSHAVVDGIIRRTPNVSLGREQDKMNNRMKKPLEDFVKALYVRDSVGILAKFKSNPKILQSDAVLYTGLRGTTKITTEEHQDFILYVLQKRTFRVEDLPLIIDLEMCYSNKTCPIRIALNKIRNTLTAHSFSIRR